MAAFLLDLILKNKHESTVIADWIAASKNAGVKFDDFEHIRCEFIPFLLNYLRDESSHLLQGCRSTNQSPIKTPMSIKRLKQKAEQSTESTDSTRGKNKKPTQLFASSEVQLPNKSIDDSLSDLSGFTNLSLESPSAGSMMRTPEAGSRMMKTPEAGSRMMKTPEAGSCMMKTPETGSRMMKTPEAGSRMMKTPEAGSRMITSTPIAPTAQTCRQLKISPCTSTPKNNKGKSRRPLPDKSHSFADIIATPESARRKKKSPRNERRPRRSSTKKVEKSLAESFSKVEVVPNATPSRRITPTPVTPRSTDSRLTISGFQPLARQLLSDDSSSSVQSTVFNTAPVNVVNNIEHERQLLRMHKEKQSSSLDLTPAKEHTPDKRGTPVTHRLSSCEVISADRSCVTHEVQLDMLIDMYCACLDWYLVPNIIVELYFIFQLLTCKVTGADMMMPCTNNNEVNYFSTVHNVVYFAVQVLQRQRKLLSMLEKSVLRLLTDNERVQRFHKDFHHELQTELQSHQAKLFIFNPPSPIGGVPFQEDTDNKNNFPSESAFHLFKKQRDKFYELLREWQEHHFTPGWSMSEQQGDRIQGISTKVPIVNQIHFTRLFVLELIHTCTVDGNSRSEDLEREEEQNSQLSQLKMSDPKKLKRLQGRLTTRDYGGVGPCPPPLFLGREEFFKDFIVCASNCTFNQHLMHTIAHKISQLQQVQIETQELIESDSEEGIHIDQEDRDSFSCTILSLCLLGKFMGFIAYLPYQSSEAIPEIVEQSYISARKQISSPIDLLTYVRRSQSCGRLVLTIPWVLQYLSMMDEHAQHLEVIHEIFLLLLQIYRRVVCQFHQCNDHTYLLVIVLLGWFFELSIFPEELFFTDDKTNVVSEFVEPPDHCLDSMSLVDLKLFYACCPFLGELRNLLAAFTIGSRDREGSSLRKITPVSTIAPAVVTLTEKQIQLQLEDNFFHNHPTSLRQTVVFAADRISSNYIKRYRAQALLKIRRKGTEQAIERTSERTADKEMQPQKRDDILGDVAEMQCKEAHIKAFQGLISYCNEKCSEVLPLLLPLEINEGVKSVAMAIAGRIAIEKVHAWVMSRINKELFFKELKIDVEKHARNLKFRNENPSFKEQSAPVGQTTAPKGHTAPRGQPGTHADDGLFPSDVLIKLKALVEVLSESSDVEIPDASQRLWDTLQNITNMFHTRQDIVNSVTRTFGICITDLMFILIFHRPDLFTLRVVDSLSTIRLTFLNGAMKYTGVLSRKHFYWMSQTGSAQKSLDFASALLIELISTGILKVCDFSNELTNSMEYACSTLFPVDLIPPFVRHIFSTIRPKLTSTNEEICKKLIDRMDRLCRLTSPTLSHAHRSLSHAHQSPNHAPPGFLDCSYLY